MRKFTLIIWNFLTCLMIFSQTLPSEKISFDTDKTEYSIGDTIRYSGFIERADSAGPFFSKYIYVEIFDERDSLMARQKLSVKENGSFKSRIPIGTVFTEGEHIIRAFSRFMQNFPAETFPIQKLYIGKKIQNKLGNGIKASFYPEGGYLVPLEPQNMSIFLQDEWGKPVSTEFKIKDSNGIVVINQKTSPNGWSIIHFIPKEGEQYTLSTLEDGFKKQQGLPNTAHIPTLKCVLNKNKLLYFILGNKKNRYKNICAYHEQIGLLKWKLSSDSGQLFLDQLPSNGLLHFFLIDSQYNMISERTVPLETGLEKTQELESNLFSDRDCPKGNQTDLEAWLYSTSFKKFNLKRALKEGISYNYTPETIMGVLQHL